MDDINANIKDILNDEIVKKVIIDSAKDTQEIKIMPEPKLELEQEQESQNEITTFSAPSDDDIDTMYIELEITDFESLKQKKKFINSVKSLLRKTIEYSTWRNYLVQTLGVNFCVMTGEVNAEVSIHIHHHPFTVYDIISLVVDDHICKSNPFTSMDIIKEVLSLHYNNKIGYVSLSTTMHEKYHNGYLEIPIEVVHGNWRWFLTTYTNYCDEELTEKINLLSSINYESVKGINMWTKNNYKIYGTMDLDCTPEKEHLIKVNDHINKNKNKDKGTNTEIKKGDNNE